MLQAQSQLKAIYKDNADTIIGNMDTSIFLGGKEPTTLKELSAALGKETIDTFNTGESRGREERQMEKILVYLGSDHVIQHPSFGVRENILKMTTDREVAVSQACEQDAAGVINTYYLDLDSLSVKAPERQVLSGFDGYDVVIPKEESSCYISICSEAALNSLVFTNASFVSQ